jgi:ATP-dependent DNA helicase RecG
MPSSESNPQFDLKTPLQYLKGVGPERAKLLARLNLHTAQDTLFFFPRTYEDTTSVVPIAQLVPDTLTSVKGVVEEVESKNTSVGGSICGVLIRDQQHHLRAVWFNQPYMEKRFSPGQGVMLTGKVKNQGLMWEMSHPRVKWLTTPDETPPGEILPIYRLTEGIKQSEIRRSVAVAVDECVEMVEEVLPESVRQEYGLLPIRDAILSIHRPVDGEALQSARFRFVFQELLVLQLALAMQRHLSIHGKHAWPLPVNGRIDSRICRLFPFPLTDGQRQVIDEICSDMAAEVPMNRLLQGDVGSGKTVVAMYAMLLCVAHGCQASLMVPTEILCRQHCQTLGRALANARVTIAMITGGMSNSERKGVLQSIRDGEVDLVIGTHALLQEDVEFARLGLVIVDEQHRFGVRQRAQLRWSGPSPHYLVMTATPIPRTMAMTLFGDLDVSTLRDHPPGRQPVNTYLGTVEQREQWWEFFRRKLREGRQGYVITPLVDQSDHAHIVSLEQSFESLCNDELEEFRVDLVHGRLSTMEKQAAMDAFRSGETQVLVATSVVEVGVDIANATVMTIENGERFGLAQLHQLRGRVGRGTHPGYVCVFSPATEETQQRLNTFVSTSDGFELAEADFQMRGPGDLLGVKQHGLPPLRIADLCSDGDVLVKARTAAQEMINADPDLQAEPLAKLRRMVLLRYGNVLELGEVG